MTKTPVKTIAQNLESARNQSGQVVANDLFRDLEQRWGSGFAQWVVDGLGAEQKKEA